TEHELAPNDEIHLGHTRLLFVEHMGQLPDLPVAPPDTEVPSIKKRLGHTRFLTPIPPIERQQTQVPEAHHKLNRELSLLYRLALDMGSASDTKELIGIVLDGLLEATPADVGAILSVGPAKQIEVIDYRNRHPQGQTYSRVSEYVSNEVLNTREAILAEDVAGDRHLRNRESLSDIGARSLICAPVIFGDEVYALIHLYCTAEEQTLDAENLEFAIAVAKHLGAAIYRIGRQDSLRNENQSLRDQLRVESELVGDSSVMKGIETQIGRVADTNATVLVRGESGSGKELVARAIHYSSRRKDGPFVCLNCAALTETLLESE